MYFMKGENTVPEAEERIPQKKKQDLRELLPLQRGFSFSVDS